MIVQNFLSIEVLKRAARLQQSCDDSTGLVLPLPKTLDQKKEFIYKAGFQPIKENITTLSFNNLAMLII